MNKKYGEIEVNIIKKIRKKIKKIIFKKHLIKIQKDIYEDLVNLRLNYLDIYDDDLSCDFIILSKDRAMQLHTLLSSVKDMVKNYNNIYVLYTTSNKNHFFSYEELKSIFKNIKFIHEDNFRDNVIDIVEMSTSGKIAFLCDDLFFKEKVDIHEITKYNPYLFCFSLIRGKDANVNFNRKDTLPNFIENIVETKNHLFWKWGDNSHLKDWSYPLNVGGTFYSRKEILYLLKMTNFEGPNTLEGRLQIFKKMFLPRFGVCAKSSIVGYVPCNVVSKESTVPNTGIYTADELLVKWNNGYRINYEKLYYKKYDELFYTKFQFVKR